MLEQVKNQTLGHLHSSSVPSPPTWFTPMTKQDPRLRLSPLLVVKQCVISVQDYKVKSQDQTTFGRWRRVGMYT